MIISDVFGEFLTFNAYKLNSSYKTESDLFLYTKNLLNEPFEFVFYCCEFTKVTV